MFSLFRQLHSARLAKRITQADLASQLHLGQSYLSQVERGKHDIRTSSLIEWARMLDLELMLVPRQSIAAVTYLTGANDLIVAEEIPPAYGPLPDEV